MAQNKKVEAKDANRDPITGEPGAHPVGVGIGTAAGGAAAGAAAGMIAGPVGTAVGAVVGGVMGGLAGKAAAEQVNPTAEDVYWREHYHTRPYVDQGAAYDVWQPAYRYGYEAQTKYQGKAFADAETDLRQGWDKARGASSLTWDKAREAVRDAYDRVLRLHEEQLRVHKAPVQTGEVNVRKEVITEHRTIDVPVEREEVVIERRPVSGHTGAADIRAEEIRIPVKEEQVHVSKEAVVKEEVTVGKRKVHDTAHVEGDVRKEQLKVEEKGKVEVRGDVKSKKS
jgi:uncharacterized protein (TIGR02271 family)